MLSPSATAGVVVGTVFGVYAIVSVVLLRHPHWLHKRRTQGIQVTHGAHRGGAGEQLENTLRAFDHAVALGTHLLEMDVHLASCGTVVVSHDRHLHRLTGETVDLTRTPVTELPAIQTRLGVTFAPHAVTEVDRSETFARFDEVLARYPNVALSVDVKEDDDKLIDAVIASVAASGHAHVILGSFYHRVVVKLAERYPHGYRFYSARECFMLYFLFFTGLLPFVPLRRDFFMFAMPSALVALVRVHFPKAACVIRCMDTILMRPWFFDHLRARGVQVVLWTLNDEASFERAFRLGASGVLTDYPSRLSAYLAANPRPAAAGDREPLFAKQT